MTTFCRFLVALPIVAAAATAGASTIYTYTGNNFDTVSGFLPPYRYDESMSVTVTLEFTDPLEPNLPLQSKFPVSFSISAGSETIDPSNEWFRTLEIGTDAAGMINAWNISLLTNQTVGPRWTISTSNTRDMVRWNPFEDRGGGDPSIIFWETARVNNRPGNWSVSAPECEIRMDQSTYVDGDTVTAGTLRIANLSDAPIATEIKIWLSLPDAPPASALNLGSDGSFVLPAGSNAELGPLPLFPVAANLPRGSYEFSCRMLDPVTGERLTEDRNFFDIGEERSYAIGQTGPGGGIVFHVTDGGVHGLEAAPADQGEAEWGCHGTLIAGADGTETGAGRQNTADILSGCAEPGIAAALADAYVFNGFVDWFLPSRDELELLFLQQNLVGGFNSNEYWSSSENSDSSAWARIFSSSGYGTWQKDSTYGVRAIRDF